MPTPTAEEGRARHRSRRAHQGARLGFQQRASLLGRWSREKASGAATFPWQWERGGGSICHYFWAVFAMYFIAFS